MLDILILSGPLEAVVDLLGVTRPNGVDQLPELLLLPLGILNVVSSDLLEHQVQHQSFHYFLGDGFSGDLALYCLLCLLYCVLGQVRPQL